MSFVRKERQSASTMAARSQKRNSLKSRKKKKIPVWDNSTTDLSVHKLSNEELERRRQIHKSTNLPSVKAERQMRALLKANRKNTNSTSGVDRSSLLQEILYDEEQLTDAVGYSDRIMAVVHDLFGDDPTMRSGKANVTLAPGVGKENSATSSSRTLPDMTLHPSRLDVLSESVMDPQALNDLREDHDEERSFQESEEEEEQSIHHHSYKSSLDLERFRRYIQKESEEKDSNEVSKHLKDRHWKRSLKGPVSSKVDNVAMSLLYNDEAEESTDGSEDSHPAIRAINDTAKVKKKSRSRTGGGEDATQVEDADLAMVIGGIKSEVKEYENVTGAKVLPKFTEDESSNGTLFLFETIRSLIRHLKEVERSGGSTSIARLKSETEDQRSIINALTLELIKTQERLSKLEDIVKKLGPSRDLNETPPGNITVQANQNPSQGDHPIQDQRTVTGKTGSTYLQINGRQLLPNDPVSTDYHRTQKDGHLENYQVVDGQRGGILQDNQHRFVIVGGPQPVNDRLPAQSMSAQNRMYTTKPIHGLQTTVSSDFHLLQQENSDVARAREQQELITSEGGVWQNEQSLKLGRSQGANRPPGGHCQELQGDAWGSRGVYSIPQCSKADLLDQNGKNLERTSESQWASKNSHDMAVGNENNQRAPADESTVISTRMQGLSFNDFAQFQSSSWLEEGDTLNHEKRRQEKTPNSGEFCDSNISRHHRLENVAPVALKGHSDLTFSASHFPLHERGPPLHRGSPAGFGHPLVQKVILAEGEQAVMLSPPRQLDRRALFRTHGPMPMRRSLFPSKSAPSKQMTNASPDRDHLKSHVDPSTYHTENTNTGGDSGNKSNQGGSARLEFSSLRSTSFPYQDGVKFISQPRENPSLENSAYTRLVGTMAEPDILEGVVTSDREDQSMGSIRNAEEGVPSKSFAHVVPKTTDKDTSLFSTDSHTSYQSLPVGKDLLQRPPTDMPTAALSVRTMVIPGQDPAKREMNVNQEEESALSAISDLNRRIAALSKEHTEAELRLQILKNQDVQIK